ncbi:CDP-alcohol phosphatidyltransferase family protein [Desulfobacter postgatei]|jgi:CDP-diacylglycerol--serine O-phosphatidyltransferase|uniref:CDP-alcohol phosphatidyltransferase family protein n=1 Tax=Desulfobacter postgatei TaxID=2293 RepID=UPI002A36596F|nr:CDP-alcohol phosphatidyltransferase family protein [Desulfobacter postgatei]MDX9962325.1 CDP-alcohol phosphatidyltransferase family protein [Desulfobacter postgatei]
MERILIIMASGALGSLFFFWFSHSVKKKASVRQFIESHLWLMHPNAICYWRTGLAFLGFFFYFFSPYQSLAIFIFTFAAIFDGVDGVVARGCNLVSRLGEWLDPMCDKLTYLPPLVGFAYTPNSFTGVPILSPKLIWILVAIELVGQFFVRRMLAWLKVSGAANNFGKIKAIICFALVILCALMDANPGMLNIGDGVLWSCIVLSAASMIFKFVPNRLYADILSMLNFMCGVTSLILTYHHFYAWAICVIIMGQLFDLFDGRMALKHGGTKYGPWLDDIADFVSFGLAPAYMVIMRGGTFALFFAVIYVVGVAFRLVRFVTKDKGRTDLPAGIFNGFPSPAGALIVLGTSLVSGPILLWFFTAVSTVLMVSNIRFAHLGRVILKQIPKPIFFLISATIIVILAYILKTKNTQIFGYLILASVVFYLAAGRIWAQKTNVPGTPG